jgi:hypothetical protein
MPRGNHLRLTPSVPDYLATLGGMTPLSFARYFLCVFTRVNIVYTTRKVNEKCPLFGRER